MSFAGTAAIILAPAAITGLTFLAAWCSSRSDDRAGRRVVAQMEDRLHRDLEEMHARHVAEGIVAGPAG